MRESTSILLLLLLCVGCLESPQERQAAKDAQRAATAANLKAIGEAMHNDPNNVELYAWPLGAALLLSVLIALSAAFNWRPASFAVEGRHA